MLQHVISNVATSGQVYTNKGISQRCRDIRAMSQHENGQCFDIRINLQQCILMLRHHHDMDSSLETEKYLIDF